MSDTTLCGGWLQSVKETDAVWCPVCEIWLNGQTQLEDHKIGKKHKKNLRRKQQGRSPGSHGAKTTPPKKGETVDIPPATRLLIEQTALQSDASAHSRAWQYDTWQSESQWSMVPYPSSWTQSEEWQCGRIAESTAAYRSRPSSL
jgi:hypothetical protein